MIAGGGTAGWTAAMGLSQALRSTVEITLVESDQIPTVGVGESTVPPMQAFHKLVGVDEQEFLRASAGTFKLAILFDNWARIGDRYIHSFGINGKSPFICDFLHYWLRSRAEGSKAELGEYCYEFQAAKAHKFSISEQAPKLNYAYHLDAALYSRFLRRLAEGYGVKRVEGKIQDVRLNPESGFIESLQLDSGQTIAGDLFIDCTGFRALLTEGALKTGFEDWSHWLPCDRAVAVQTEATQPAYPYTRAIAHEAGWRWAIPLQHRVGNGFVYSSNHLSEEEAIQQLLRDADGKPTTSTWTVKIRTGRRHKAWNRNCISLGLSSGFVEPLESTSIHMFQTGVIRLLKLFPRGNEGIDPLLVERYNAETRCEIESIRDFIIMHYNVTEREDTAFWRYTKNMSLPESIDHRIRLFREGGHAYMDSHDLFRVDSWAQVMLGQRVIPRSYHPAADVMDDKALKKYLEDFRIAVRDAVAQLPQHQDFINRYCRAEGVWNRAVA